MKPSPSWYDPYHLVKLNFSQKILYYNFKFLEAANGFVLFVL